MSDQNNPATTPSQGQAPGTPAGTNPAQTPPPSGASQTSGNPSQGGETTQISLEELNRYKRDAGRWEAHQKAERDNRRNRRGAQNPEPNDPDTADAVKIRDKEIERLASENFRLQTAQKISDLFQGEYKEIPDAVKKAIQKNPLGFVNPASKTVDDAVYDIQDYLDEVLDGHSPAPANPGNQGNNGNQPPVAPKPEERQTPPANGSGPASPNQAPDVDVQGKRGSARSTAILQNLLKSRK